MKIVCFGDSLTYGSIGYSYCKYIDTPYRIINKGINGDTTYCVHERLKEYLRVRQEADTSGVDIMAADIYVIHVGINDILLPYLATLSPLWKVRTDILVRIRRCIFEDALFKVEYQ